MLEDVGYYGEEKGDVGYDGEESSALNDSCDSNYKSESVLAKEKVETEKIEAKDKRIDEIDALSDLDSDEKEEMKKKEQLI